MKRFRVAALAGVFGTVVLLAGCGHAEYYAGVAYGPPAPVVEGPYGVAPGPEYIWTPGYYDWYGGRWEWRHGEWRRRPHREDRWVQPRWDREGRRYVYHPGGWEHGDNGRFHH